MSGYPYMLYINHSLYWKLNHLTLYTLLGLYDKEQTCPIVISKSLETMLWYEINTEKIK